jgi:hypothetical protein
MRRWLALGIAGLGVAWGPYVYSELTRRPFGPQQASQATPLLAAESTASVMPVRAPPAPLKAAAKAAREAESTASAASALASPESPEDKPIAAARAEADEPASARAFRKAFDTEPRDAFWASEEEPRLASWLQGAGLPEGAIAELACRTSVCRVAFTKFELDSDAEAKLRAKINAEFGRAVSFELHNPEGEERGPLYLLRAGYKLEPIR